MQSSQCPGTGLQGLKVEKPELRTRKGRGKVIRLRPDFLCLSGEKEEFFDCLDN